MERQAQKRGGREGGELMVELLIALVIISTTLIALLGTFLTTQRSYRSATASSEVASALGLVLEDMSREARVSKDYCTGGSCGRLRMTRLKGTNAQSSEELVTYTLSNGRIQKTVEGSSPLPLTPTSVSIESFTAAIPSGAPGTEPYRALINITAKASSTDLIESAASVSVQTTLTARKYNN